MLPWQLCWPCQLAQLLLLFLKFSDTEGSNIVPFKGYLQFLLQRCYNILCKNRVRRERRRTLVVIKPHSPHVL